MNRRRGEGLETEDNGKTIEIQEKSEACEEHKKKEDPVEELQKEIETKNGLIKDLQDKMLYLHAEFENFKRLKTKEVQEILKYGNETLLQELIPVLDNMEMALNHASHTDDVKAIEEGVKITFNQFLKVLEKAGVERIEAVGKKFDPNLHEALYQEERADMEPDTVISETQKGYTLNGRIVRPSRVSVSKKPEVQ
ncbi:MAG: nucleotide exchange factor GrpE [Syntrophobacterales bacterium]|jgi:molecular chaperone GrpE|nr:nucleotide exchange factor GrpE [Syntrophobacterales bacterium]